MNFSLRTGRCEVLSSPSTVYPRFFGSSSAGKRSGPCRGPTESEGRDEEEIKVAARHTYSIQPGSRPYYISKELSKFDLFKRCSKHPSIPCISHKSLGYVLSVVDLDLNKCPLPAFASSLSVSILAFGTY